MANRETFPTISTFCHQLMAPFVPKDIDTQDATSYESLSKSVNVPKYTYVTLSMQQIALIK